MTLGQSPRQPDIFRSTAAYCEGRVAPDSIYGLLHRECFGLFPDALFGDLFTDIGRRSVPPMIVAVVMVLENSVARNRVLIAASLVATKLLDAEREAALGWEVDADG